MFYAFDPIINEAANWYYMNGGKASVPVVIWGIINRLGSRRRSTHKLFTPYSPMCRGSKSSCPPPLMTQRA